MVQYSIFWVVHVHTHTQVEDVTRTNYFEVQIAVQYAALYYLFPIGLEKKACQRTLGGWPRPDGGHHGVRSVA
jgi:hypothetical protein